MNFEVNLIFDVGLHRGEDTEYYLKTFIIPYIFEFFKHIYFKLTFYFNKKVNI